jgi:hypothetical protein
MNTSHSHLISIATLLHKPAGSVAITLNGHQSGFMQAPDGRQMYFRNNQRRHVRRGRTHLVMG